jgi:hypothetical protein
VEFIVLTAEGDTVFKSGLMNSADEVEGHDTPYEPHHDLITNGDQVQIYELVMGDVNGDVTTVLERAKDPIKDNRLAPSGFTSTHLRVRHHACGRRARERCRLQPRHVRRLKARARMSCATMCSVLNVHGPALLRAFRPRVVPACAARAWNAEMFSVSHPEIQAFADMLAASDRSPSQVVADSLFLGPMGIREPARDRVRISPNPAVDGWVTITIEGGASWSGLSVHDARGALVPITQHRTASGWRVRMPDSAGTYLIRIRVDREEVIKRVVRP